MTNKTLKKLFIRLVLYVAFFPYMLIAAQYLGPKLIVIFGRLLYFKNTYIESIKTPSYPKTKEILKEFNSMGEDVIVSFDKIANGRPLDIAEMTEIDMSLFPDAAGVAYPNLRKCSIRVRAGMDEIIYRAVLIHEYLHCYGYQHTSDSEDIMYYLVTYLDKENNIRYYARKMKVDFYE